MPLEAMARACAMAISESMVLEKLFHDDQPMGGGGTGIDRGVAGPAAIADAEKRIRARTTREAEQKSGFARIGIPTDGNSIPSAQATFRRHEFRSFSNLQENLFAVQNPDGDKAERAERNRIGKCSPAGIGNVGEGVNKEP